MNYAFKSASRLYENNTHPRIYLGPSDIPVLRRAVRSGAGRKLMVAMRERVAGLSATVLGADDLPALLAGWNVNWQLPGTPVMSGLEDIAFVALIDGDADAIEAVRRVLAAAPAADAASRRETVRRFRYCAADLLAVAYDLVQPHLSAAECRAFCRWAVDESARPAHALLFPKMIRNGGGNMAIQGLLGLLHVLLATHGEPGVPDTRAWLNDGILMFEASLSTALGPEGYPEEDGGYGTGVGASLSLMAEALRRAGRFDAYRACPRYARFGQALLHLVQPWGEHLSNTGDHGDGIGGREFVLARLAAETNEPSLLWLLGTLGYAHEVTLRRGFRMPARATSLLVLPTMATPVHPARARPPTAFRDTARGIVTFRSGWRADDTFVVFDGSQRSAAAQGHAHASCGHFSLSALGEYFSIDTGRYNNEQDCHSVMLVDGKSGRSNGGEWTAITHAGRLTDYAPGAFVDTAAVDSSHQHNCYWARRQLGLVKGQGAPAYVWVVDDINKDNAWAEHAWLMQTSPENTIRTYRRHATITGWRHGNRLDVHFALPGADEYPEPHALVEITQDVKTPSAHKYIRNPEQRAAESARPSDMVHGPVYVRPRLIARIQGLNGRVMAVMLPRPRAGKPARVRRIASLPASLALRITFDDVEDTLIVAHDHQLLEAGDVRGRGKWCVIRRSRESRRVLEYAMGSGISLQVGQRKLL